jgi:hypothetical protein
VDGLVFIRRFEGFEGQNGQRAGRPRKQKAALAGCAQGWRERRRGTFCIGPREIVPRRVPVGLHWSAEPIRVILYTINGQLVKGSRKKK